MQDSRIVEGTTSTTRVGIHPRILALLAVALLGVYGCGGSSGGGAVHPANLPPIINVIDQPNGALNVPFGFQFLATDGQPPYTWAETGALPAGLNFSTQGGLAGTPTEVGSFPITVTVHDSAGKPAMPSGFTVQIFPHGFQATADMGTKREAHTATLLADGKVLITGGYDDDDFENLSSAEIFDPVAETFVSTGDMTTPRFLHTATLLANGPAATNGKVLITGGSGDLATAELFDPATGTFTATGPMLEPRAEHTATLLANGKVLVAGGTVGNTAELFDPATGTFTSTGNLITGGRWGCTATLLKDGTVLIAGGRDAEDVFDALSLNVAELYNPATGTFTATGRMTDVRYDHTATLLNNGKVLLAGGFNGNPVGDAELFDPTAGTFSATGGMTTARAQHTATLLSDGTVLVAGGFSSTLAPLSATANVDIFDPATNMFTAAASLENGRFLHTATRLNNDQVLITGGVINSFESPASSAELYK